MSDLIIIVAVCVLGYFTFKHEDRIDRLEAHRVSVVKSDSISNNIAQWDSIANKTALEVDSIFSKEIKALQSIE